MSLAVQVVLLRDTQNNNLLIMPSYVPVTQKVEGALDENEILLFQESKEISSAGELSASSNWKDSLWRLRKFNLTEIGLVLLLIVSNLLWFISSKPWARPILRDPDYFGTPDKIMVSFDHDWIGIEDNSSARYAQEKWKGVFPTLGSSVALTDDFVKKHGLPPSVRAVDQPDKFIYQIAGYHQLHCLYQIRNQLYDPSGLGTMEDKLQRDHILHCVEAVRQALYCFLDPTLINLEPKWPHVPNGRKHVCRNRDALRAWTEEHGHVLPDE